MYTRFIVAALFVLVATASLIAIAARNSARAVVTVAELVRGGADLQGVRLGARVTSDKINYTTSPRFDLRFTVQDIGNPAVRVPVVYQGIMPDTLQAGRDVILEGAFTGGTFEAKTLLTQCPSKYRPPTAEAAGAS